MIIPLLLALNLIYYKFNVSASCTYFTFINQLLYLQHTCITHLDTVIIFLPTITGGRKLAQLVITWGM